MNSELISLYQAKEKEIHDKWVTTKGFLISVTPVSIVDGQGKLVQHDLDPFNIDVGVLNHQVGTIKSYDNSYDAHIVLVNTEFEYIPLSTEILINKLNSTKSKNTLSGVFAWINGKPIPQKSKISFKELEGMEFEIKEVMIRRGFTDVFKYSLVRV